jgi:alkaline phosphatase D
VHFAEISRFDCGVSYPLYEITSSGLTHGVEDAVPSLSFLPRFAALLTPTTMRVFGSNCRYKSCVYGNDYFKASFLLSSTESVVFLPEMLTELVFYLK